MQVPQPPRQAHQEVREVPPLFCDLRRYWGSVELVCISIGHAGTTLYDTATGILPTLAKVRPSIAANRKTKGLKTQDINKTALIHDTRIAKSLLDKP